MGCEAAAANQPDSRRPPQSRPQAAPARECLRTARARNGSWTLRVQAEDGTEKAIHSFYDPEGEAEKIAASFSCPNHCVIVILGLGLGYHVAALSRRLPPQRLLVLEARPEFVELQRSCGPPLERAVRILCGPSTTEAMEEISRLLREEGHQALSVFQLRSAVAAYPSFYRPLLEMLERPVSRDVWGRFKYAKFQGERIRIGLIDFGYFLTREVERSASGMGYEVERIGIRKGMEGEGAVRAVIDLLERFRPDFLLTINHLGFDKEGILTSFLRGIELPAAVWYVDNPNLVVRAFAANVSPYVSVMLWDRGYASDVRAMGFEHVNYLPLATDPAIFRPLRLTPAERRSYQADVGFVGNSMWDPVRDWTGRVAAELHPLLEETAARISRDRITVQEALTISGRAGDIGMLPETERLDFEGAALWRATMLYRRACVAALRPFLHRVHGDEGWKHLLNGGYQLGGRLSYYQEVPRFYNACRVILNATSAQMGTAVNQRVFDVPACGTLLLSDWQESLLDLFEPERECLCYRDAEEIPELLRRCLSERSDSRAMAWRARERVLAQHTYRHRIQEIVRVMRENYGTPCRSLPGSGDRIHGFQEGSSDVKHG